MNYNEIERQIELLEDMIIKNFDNHIIDYLIVDIAGQPNRLESVPDNTDEYEYFKDRAIEIKDLIDQLIPETGLIFKKGIGYDYDRKTKSNILLKRLVTLCYEIYKRVKGNKAYSKSDFEKILEYEPYPILSKLNTEKLKPIELNIKNIKQEFLEKLRSLLIKHNYISNISKKDFYNHFSKEPSRIQPIQWKKEYIISFYVFMYLMKLNFLEENYARSIWVNTCPHFLDNDGKKMKSNLSSYRGNLYSSTHLPDLENNIFNPLLKFSQYNSIITDPKFKAQ